MPEGVNVARYVRAARLIVGFEKLWPLLWPASGLAGLFLALAWFGLLPLLPWPLHALVLALFVTAIALSLYLALQGFVWPGWHEGARRLEDVSGLAHRPISEADDALAAGMGDALAEALWAADRIDRLKHLTHLKLFWPRVSLRGRDPRRLRFVLAGVLLVAFVVSWGQWGTRFSAAFGPAGSDAPSLDAWIDPPAYTGVAPVYLSPDMHRLAVPAGSVLNVRVHGAASAPFLSLQGLHFPWWPQGSHKLEGHNGEYAASAALNHDTIAQVRAIGRTIGRWDVDVIADKPPTVAFVSAPAGNERAALKITFAAHDDYAVISARAIITPADGHGQPLVVDLAVAPGKDISQTVYRDLTSHPYAGLAVNVVLEVTDAAGQSGRSNPAQMVLPQLKFSDPLAKALVEMRRLLARQGWDARGRVLKFLDALSLAPENFYVDELHIYHGQRHAYWALKFSRVPADLARVQALLWQMAVVTEQGASQPLAEDLNALQQSLSRMLAQGAPQELIDAMLERYAQAMQRYLQAKGQSGERLRSSDPAARTLGPHELNDLLAAIQTLSQSGNRAKAAELLSFLQNLLENVQMSGSGAPGGGGDSSANPAYRALSDLADKQRALLDKTFRAAQGGAGDKAALAREQAALKNALDGVLKEAPKASGDMKRAGELMEQARAALAMGDLPRAGTLQKYVLDSLRKGAASVAPQPKSQTGADPFGRGGAGQRGMPIPSEQVLKRARDILEELRQKAGEMGRPQEEREYIERLLKQF